MLPKESLRLSLDDADESGCWFFDRTRWGNNPASLLCNGGGRGGGAVWRKGCWALALDRVSVGVRGPLSLTVTGRGGMGGGVGDIVSEVLLAPWFY